MMKLLLALALTTVTAFVPSAAPRASTTVRPAVTDMEGISAPIGFFDPLGLAKTGGPETLAWFREAEIKHGRVCMAAFVGLVVNKVGISFPFPISLDGTTFKAALGVGEPFQAWDQLSLSGKESIIGFIGLLEVLGEAEKPHYMMGGKSGSNQVTWLFGSKFLEKSSAETKATKRLAEINNGRLAMIGVMGWTAAACIEGSVPPFAGVVGHYAGNPFAPFQ